MKPTPIINRHGWLAIWLQGRRRKRAHPLITRPDQPPAPVVTLFEVIDNNGMIDVNVAWSWDGQGWPDDGVFLITIDADDDASGGVLFLANALVAGPGRTCSMASIGVAEDKGYYCRVKYKKDTDASADSATVYGNPY